MEQEQFMFIQNQQLLIRNATTDDASILCKWWNDGKIMAHAGFPYGINTTEDAIASKLKEDTDETHRRLILEIDGVSVGEMNYRNKGDQTAEIGIKICDFSQRNKGNGRKFLSMLIQSLFEDLEYKKIILDTNVKNLVAQNVYDKLGFKKIGIRENSWKDQAGEMQSSIDYELFEHDFINHSV
jgi:RimJ/RimL family protein N-acetyltransferase